MESEVFIILELYFQIASYLTSSRDRLRLGMAAAYYRAQASGTTFADELAGLALTWRLTLDRRRHYSNKYHLDDAPSPHWDAPRTVGECRWALLDGRSTHQDAAELYIRLGGDEPAVVEYIAKYFGEALLCDELASWACSNGRLRILRRLASSLSGERLDVWLGRHAAHAAAAAARAGDAGTFAWAAAAWKAPARFTDDIDMSCDVYEVVSGACRCGDYEFYGAVRRWLPPSWLNLIYEYQWRTLLSEAESFAPPIRTDVLRHFPTALPAEDGWQETFLIRSGRGDCARTFKCPHTCNAVSSAAKTGDLELCRWAVGKDSPRGHDAIVAFESTDCPAVAAWAAAAMSPQDRMSRLHTVCAHGKLDIAVAAVDTAFRKRYRSTHSAGQCVTWAVRHGWLKVAQWAYEYFDLRWDHCFGRNTSVCHPMESGNELAYTWMLDRCTAEGAELPEPEAVRAVAEAIRSNRVAIASVLLQHPATAFVAKCPATCFWEAVGHAAQRGHVEVLTWYLTASPWRAASAASAAASATASDARDAHLGWLASAREVATTMLLAEHFAPLSDAERARVIATAEVRDPESWDDSVAGARCLRWLEVCR